MKIFEIILTILFIFPLFAEETQSLIYPAANEYEAVQVAFIPSGDALEEVECFMDVKPGGVGHESPTTWTIGVDGQIYIADDRKARIAVYDLKGKYIRQIKNDEIYLDQLYFVYVTKEGNIYCQKGGNEPFIKMDSNGKIIYKIQPKNLRGFNGFFYTYGDYVFYYRIKELKGFNPKGEVMTADEVNNFLLTTNEKEKNKGIRSYEDIEKPLEKFLIKEKLIYNNEKLFLTMSSLAYNKLWSIMENNPEIRKIKTDYWSKSINKASDRSMVTTLSRNNIVASFDMNEYRENAGGLLGYDNEGNMAFAGRNDYTIIDKYGSVLDVFKCTNIDRYTTPFIVPDGDIYFIRRDKSGVTIKKVTRRW